MTKQVLITIKGLQTMGGDAPEEVPIEMMTQGEYYYRNGHHFISYDEVMEGFEGVTKNLIKIKPAGVEVSKKGVTNVHMVFEENKKNITYYTTPFGNMQMGLSATKVNLQEHEESIDVSIEYALDINEQFVADCKISLGIRSL